MSKYFVHESSFVDAGAQIGEHSKIWHFCHIQSGAVIGKHCSLGQNVNVADGALIGNHVKIQNNVSVYSGVTLKDNVFCGPSCVFTNDLNPRAAYPKGSINYVRTLVDEGASIGANATIICGTRIGRWALVGAGSVVSKDVKDYAVVVGVPARQTGWVCECGALLKDTLQCACGRSYYETEQGLVENRERE